MSHLSDKIKEVMKEMSFGKIQRLKNKLIRWLGGIVETDLPITIRAEIQRYRAAIKSIREKTRIYPTSYTAGAQYKNDD